MIIFTLLVHTIRSAIEQLSSITRWRKVFIINYRLMPKLIVELDEINKKLNFWDSLSELPVVR